MPRMRWRVVCARGVTMESGASISAFSSVDLPTFGRPTIATLPQRNELLIETPRPVRNKCLDSPSGASASASKALDADLRGSRRIEQVYDLSAFIRFYPRQKASSVTNNAPGSSWHCGCVEACKRRLRRHLLGGSPAAAAAFEARRARLVDRAHHVEYARMLVAALAQQLVAWQRHTPALQPFLQARFWILLRGAHLGERLGEDRVQPFAARDVAAVAVNRRHQRFECIRKNGIAPEPAALEFPRTQLERIAQPQPARALRQRGFAHQVRAQP